MREQKAHLAVERSGAVTPACDGNRHGSFARITRSESEVTCRKCLRIMDSRYPGLRTMLTPGAEVD